MASFNPNAKKALPLARPGTKEIGWADTGDGQSPKIQTGGESSVQLRVPVLGQPNAKAFVYHTHPCQDPSPLMSLPSVQDISTTINLLKNGYAGQTIVAVPTSGNGTRYITTIVRKAPNIEPRQANADEYNKLVQSGNLSKIVQYLNTLGFKIETNQV